MNVGALGPDERTYWQQAELVRERGPISGIRAAATRFLDNPGATQLPSPARWLWIWLHAVTSRVSRRAMSLLCATMMPLAAWLALDATWQGCLLAATSPLLWVCGKRALQDTTVALAVVLTLGAVLDHSLIVVALGVFALLSLKEAAILYLPAFAFVAQQGDWVVPALLAMSVATILWILTSRLVVGRDFWRVFRAASSGHGSDYTKRHQSGGLHRLIVDLALISPAALLLCADLFPGRDLAAFLLVAVVLHAVSPVQNVRTILAVDAVMRVGVGATLVTVDAGLWSLPFLVAVDAVILWHLRNVYDPVTSELTRSLGMSRNDGIQTS